MPRQLASFLRVAADGRAHSQLSLGSVATGFPEHWPSGLRTTLRILLPPSIRCSFSGDPISSASTTMRTAVPGPREHPATSARKVSSPGRRDLVDHGPRLTGDARQSATWLRTLVPIIATRRARKVPGLTASTHRRPCRAKWRRGCAGDSPRPRSRCWRSAASPRAPAICPARTGAHLHGDAAGSQHVVELANLPHMRLVNNRLIIDARWRGVAEIVEQGYLKLLDEVCATGKAFRRSGADCLRRSQWPARNLLSRFRPPADQGHR